MIVRDKDLEDLYDQMSKLTYEQCLKDCVRYQGHIGSCCDKMYCEIAFENAGKAGVTISREDGNLPAMGAGGCIIPAYLRPMCTMHICDKSLNSRSFFRDYFSLRDKINEMEEIVYAKEISTLVHGSEEECTDEETGGGIR